MCKAHAKRKYLKPFAATVAKAQGLRQSADGYAGFAPALDGVRGDGGRWWGMDGVAP